MLECEKAKKFKLSKKTARENGKRYQKVIAKINRRENLHN